MPAVPCANHPKAMTYVRCGRCDKPICIDCMVDSPVGKKCGDCARNRTHITESGPNQVLPAFAAATVVAVLLGFVMTHYIPIIIAPFIYGAVVGEVALRAGQRRRSLAMQFAAGLAALIGVVVGAGLVVPVSRFDPTPVRFVWTQVVEVWNLLLLAFGVVSAVSRVRFL